jgi:hypothetical protein
MPELLTNGFITIISQTKLAHHIKLLGMTMVLDALLILNVETVSQIKDVGLNKELKFTECNNLVMLLDNKT